MRVLRITFTLESLRYRTTSPTSWDPLGLTQAFLYHRGMAATSGNVLCRSLRDCPSVLGPRCRLNEALERLYDQLNRPEFIPPDPLQFLADYPRLEDREIVGLIASSLAFGNVKQILRSVSLVLAEMDSPHAWLMCTSERSIAATFRSFRHRYVDGADLGGMLCGVKRTVQRHGSLGACFALCADPADDNVLPGLVRFVERLQYGSTGPNYLLPSPTHGSACKRLNLFMRWMVRRDAVDPGGWDFISPAHLVVPLDTHMHRIAKALGLTSRRSADIRTALEVTAAFRRFAPGDPVRYDFTLTRLGIRSDIDVAGLFSRSWLERSALV
jgi:uncharacterized protein (TIGR02757 family)